MSEADRKPNMGRVKGGVMGRLQVEGVVRKAEALTGEIVSEARRTKAAHAVACARQAEASVALAEAKDAATGLGEAGKPLVQRLAAAEARLGELPNACMIQEAGKKEVEGK